MLFLIGSKRVIKQRHYEEIRRNTFSATSRYDRGAARRGATSHIAAVACKLISYISGLKVIFIGMAFSKELEEKLGQVVGEVTCRIEWLPNLGVIVEGGKGLYYYSPECVKVRAKGGMVVVEGEGLYVYETRTDEVVLRGGAASVRWE